MTAITSKSSAPIRPNYTTSYPTPDFNVWLGLIILYFVWGSTYLAIRFVVESVPPMLVSGMRTTLAGLILFSFGKFFGKNFVKPTPKDWKLATLTGLLMITIGNGAISFAARLVPSGLSALFGAQVPVLMTIMTWYLDKKRPSYKVILGCMVGIIGVGYLMSLSHLALDGKEAYFGWGIFFMMLGGISWSVGVMITSRATYKLTPATLSGMQLLVGGIVSLVISGLLGDFSKVEPLSFNSKPVLSFLYLLSFGSLLGFSVFGWLTQKADPTLVSTYTYVNPLVAITLGFLLAGEPLNPQMLIAASLIVGAVVLITRGKKK